MMKNKLKQAQRERRHLKVRAKIEGSTQRPRLSVFRSNKGMYLQLIDDSKGVTLASANAVEVKTKGGKIELAKECILLAPRVPPPNKTSSLNPV